MAVIIEPRSEQRTDFSDLAAGWRRFGNITVSHDTSRATFERANASSAAYAFPLPAANGAGFIETSVSQAFELVVDLATDSAHASGNTQWVGISLRRNDGQCQWLYPNHATGTLISVRDTGAGPTFETAMVLPSSASHRWVLHVRWDADASTIAVRARAYEDRDDLGGWFDAVFTTTSLTAAPVWAGISMAAPSGTTDPELYVYSLRLLEPERLAAGNWFALADVAGNRESVELLLNRKSRATAAAFWSRDDYALAGSPKSVTGSTPLRDLQASFSRNELRRYRAALEMVTGLELEHAWFGVPRCAVSDALLYTELGSTIVTAAAVSGMFGTRAMSFTATNDHSFAAFDLGVAEIPDSESWLAMFVVSPTVVPALNVPLCGKQDLFQIAPTPRNGWQIWLRTTEIMLDLSDTAGGSNTVAVAKTYSAGTFFAICARVNRATGLAQIAHDTAASATLSVAGLSYLCPLRPFRIGDSRINRSETAPAARVHLAAIARGTQVEAIALQTLAGNLLASAT